MPEHYEKLVRDNVPEILDAKGVSYELHTADDAEYRARLIAKLAEEIREFIADESVEELADIMEIVRALRRLPEFENAKDVQRAKREERGGFENRTVIKGEKD